MNDRLKKILAEVDRKGWAPFYSIRPSLFDRRFLGRAFEVAPGQCLMHYMRVDRFKTLMVNRAIYMGRLDLFEQDPHEGRFPASNSTCQSSITESFTSQIGMATDELKARRDFIEGPMRQMTYVHCWFGWDNEDQRMWEEYGNKGDGVCIRTTARRLLEALVMPSDFVMNICGVTYSGSENPVSELISFLASCRKRPEFAHEREIRLIGHIGEKAWPTTITDEGNTTPDHKLIGVNPERLFERVYVGPNASDAVFQQVEALANKAAGCRVMHRSSVAPFPSP